MKLFFPLILTLILILANVVGGGIFISSSKTVFDNPVNQNFLEIKVALPHVKEFNVVNYKDWDIIKHPDFSYLTIPNKPMLPTKNYLVALPPGALVTSIEIRETSPVTLPDTYRILPCPPPLLIIKQDNFLTEHNKKWIGNNNTSYCLENEYPDNLININGKGTLRKYNYISFSLCPFKYYLNSGRLTYFNTAKIVIHYSINSISNDSPMQNKKNLWDTVADNKASKLFINYEQILDFYKSQQINLPPTIKLDEHDYLIITSPNLVEAINSSDFLQWKTSLGYNIKIVNVSDEIITQQTGSDLAEKIRNFLRQYYDTWGIKYVLLVGDYTTIPMRYCSPNPNGLEGVVPTDTYYADLSFPDNLSWDSNNDGYYGVYGEDNPDFMPEVYVGRIPTSDNYKITYTLNKIVAFEQDTGEWKNNALQGGAMLFYANEDHDDEIDHDIDGASSLEAIEKDILLNWTVSHYCEHEGLSPSTYDWEALSEESFTRDWRNNHYAIINWAAHGAPTSIGRVIWDWDDGDGVPEHDNGELIWGSFLNTYSKLEDDYPSIVFAVSCNVGYPEPTSNGNLGIDMLTEESFGAAVGICSATRGAAVSSNWAVSHAGAEALCYEFNHYLINGPYGPVSIGEALYDSKFYVHDNFGWDHYLEFQNMFDYNLYGDPSMIREGLSLKSPEIKITNPDNGLYFNNNKIFPFLRPVILGEITIKTSASDSISYVEFYVDGILKERDVITPYSWVWNEKAFFRHTIKVIAYDGKKYTSSDEIIIWKFF